MKYSLWGIVAVSIAVLLSAGGPLYTGDKAIKKVPTTHKVVALTFDDGPHPRTTPALLSVLKAKNVSATFFVLGTSVEKYPSLLADIVANGQEVASHSYTHRFINKLRHEEFENELDKAEKLIMNHAPKPTLFRPPGGGYNDRLVLEMKQKGYTTILWTIDPRDWDNKGAEAIAATVVNKVSPGAIVLLHEGDCAAATPAAVGKIIDILQEQGYKFVPVGELLGYYEIRE
jgi:peptidoglycan/xylan/chitin deacetylase (PgdA/CDA1 family)